MEQLHGQAIFRVISKLLNFQVALISVDNYNIPSRAHNIYTEKSILLSNKVSKRVA